MKFSVIIPVQDKTRHLLPFTLDSIANQAFDSFEILIIDGQSKEHNLEIFDAYDPYISRIYSALDNNLSAMLNKGVSLAQGKYLHFLMPGEYYLSRFAFTFMEEFLLQSEEPDLAYTGYVLRHSFSPSEQLFTLLSVRALKRGRVAPTLQPYWFRKEALLRVGKFDTSYEQQGGYDLLCRLYRSPHASKSFLRRILTDYEYRRLEPKKVFTQFWERLLIIWKHFGWSKAPLWWLAQNHKRLWRWWMRVVKSSFWKEV